MVTSVTIMTMTQKGRAIAAGEFKAKCLRLLDDVHTKGTSFVVTKRGRPVARVVPLAKASVAPLRNTVLVEQGLLDPVDALWEDA